MLYKNVASQKIAVFAYTASTGAAKTGDAAQITAYISKDFAAGAATNDVNPTEMDATNMPGWYVFDLTQAETNAEVIVLAPKSSTSGVVLDQVQVFTQDAAISSRASQASVDDLPTNAELATALGTANDATLAAIAALNNLSSAQAQAAAMAALEAYDPPTNAEMVARTLLAASYFDPATDTVARVTLVDTTTTNTDMVAAAPSAATVADAVWDEALSGHAGAGSTGAALSASGAAGDPWSTALPGAYGAGTAGKLLSDIEAVAPDNKPTIAATGEASANVTYSAGVAVSGRLAEATDIPAAVDVLLLALEATAQAVLAAIGGQVVEGAYTRDEILRIVAAALAGATSGSGTSTVEILGLDGATTRITATLDGSGNRTGMTLDGER